MSYADVENASGKDFEFLITGDIDVFFDWDKVMTPNTINWRKEGRDNWVYYNVDNDYFYFSIEPPGIQMMFNDRNSFGKAKKIVDEIVENIKSTGQEATLIIINSNNIYNFK